MSNYGRNVYVNRIYEIDTSRSNVKKIMNPSIKYYPVEDYNATKQAAQVQEKTAVESLEERRQSDTGAGDAATGPAGMAGVIHTTGAASKANVSAGAQVPNQHSQESDPTDSGFKLDFTNESILNGIILAEVLGKPKYFRKGRR